MPRYITPGTRKHGEIRHRGSALKFSADDGCDLGEETGAPVSPDYGPRGNAFPGRVKGVQIAIADAAESFDTWSCQSKPCASRWPASKQKPRVR